MSTFELVLLFIKGIVPAICFAVGRKLIGKKRTLYLRMIIDGVGCIALGKVFVFTKAFTEGVYPMGFHIGVLSTVGAMAFFFASNYGQINTLCDDGSPKFKKYRIISALAAVIFVLISAFIYTTIENKQDAVIFAVVAVFVALTGYYHFKLLIFPDVDFGVVKCLRAFNFTALLYSFSVLAEYYLITTELSNALYAVMVCEIVLSAMLIPVTLRGVKKWTM